MFSGKYETQIQLCFVLFPLYFLIFIFTIIMYVIVIVIEVDYFQTIQEGFVIFFWYQPSLGIGSLTILFEYPV